MMCKTHGLCHLQMREAGQDDVNVALGHFNQRFLQVIEQATNEVNLADQPKAHVGGHLVIPASTCVQALACIAYDLREACFDVEVHIFQVQFPIKLTLGDFLGNLRHAALNVGKVLVADDFLGCQHLCVRQTALDVRLPQALVEENAGGVALHQVTHRLGKQGRPGLGLLIELIFRHFQILSGCQASSACGRPSKQAGNA